MAFLFTGDIGEGVESDIIAGGFEVSSTILKVAHHGSKYSSSIKFLSEVRPKVAVISVGGDNPYGHPTQETLNRLKTINTEIYRTDVHGTVVVESNGTSYTISTSNKTPVGGNVSISCAHYNAGQLFFTFDEDLDELVAK